MILPYRILINIAIDEGGRPLKHMRYLDQPLVPVGDPPEVTFPLVYYQRGDLVVETWRGEIEAPDFETAIGSVWMRHNRDDRPDGQIGPSLSLGDVVVIGDRAVAIEDGMPLDIPMPTNLYSGTWLEFMEGLRNAKSPTS